MATKSATRPIEDTVAKVDNDLAVGSNIEFQRKWWRFTRFIWMFFLVIIVADVSGAFGRGPLANAELKASDGSVNLSYERIERFSTPSIMTIDFSPSVI